jgi:hypothetical protein
MVKTHSESGLHTGDGARQLNGSLCNALGNDAKPVLLSECANSRHIACVGSIRLCQLLTSQFAMASGDFRRVRLPSHHN